MVERSGIAKHPCHIHHRITQTLTDILVEGCGTFKYVCR
jgi:hypothetical protein